MRTTIDKAGRVVIPKALRDRVGMQGGEVEISVEGAALRIEPVSGNGTVERGGVFVIPASGETITVDEVRALMEQDRR